MAFVLVMMMSFHGDAIDHIDFKTEKECNDAGKMFVQNAYRLKYASYVCLRKSL